MKTERLAVVRSWHFLYPKCSIGDQEIGGLAEAHEIHCEICFVELDRLVRLRRWPADDAAHETAEGDAAALRRLT